MKMLTIRYFKSIHACHLSGIGRSFVFVLFVFGITPFAYGVGEDGHNAVANTEGVKITNTYCPVMPDMQTSPEIFTEYKGKRVYFCCKNCKASFGKTPEKYLDRLPQFGGTIVRKEQGQGQRLELPSLIKPMGIVTLFLLLLTGSGRLFRKRVPKFLIRQHKRLGVITVISALIHATLVLIAH